MKAIRSVLSKTFGRKCASTSISDNGSYPAFCLQASVDSDTFSTFRKNPTYTAILEHVTEEQGARYLEHIMSTPGLLHAMEEFRKNDNVGSPHTYCYSVVGRFSPSTLRYVKVLGDLTSFFGALDKRRICEIGIGYGGQCRVIDAFYRPASYVLVDITPALALARRYLASFQMSTQLEYMVSDALPDSTYDLVISNYAFTELPRPLQNQYLEKIILRSDAGYITYNEISPSQFRSYSAEELLRIIPGARRFEEKPLTHPNNCILVWGAD
jgi:hypothetical protein